MKRLLLTFFVLLLSLATARGQIDSSKVAMMDTLLSEYFQALKYYSVEEKAQECDRLIMEVDDSLLAQHAAVKIYSHYISSLVMGEEGVAVHIFDKWFATGKISMYSELDYMNASVYADFNRSSLVGCDAPVLTMIQPSGDCLTFSFKDRVSVLYFYDTDCSKCKVQTNLLRYALSDFDKPLDLYAIYVGDDAAAWEDYRLKSFELASPTVAVHHLWDPDIKSDFQRQYGVLTTPQMVLVDFKGKVVGRKLDSRALLQLLNVTFMEKALYDRCPAGSKVPEFVFEGELWKSGRRIFRGTEASVRVGTYSTRKLRGRQTFLVLHSAFCQSCHEEYEAAMQYLCTAPRGTRIFFVKIDDILSSDARPGSMEAAVLDAFDLSFLPYIVKLNRRGIVQERYCTFKGK